MFEFLQMRQITAAGLPRLTKERYRGSQVVGKSDIAAARMKQGVKTMADKELEITTNTYIFAGVGAVLLGGIASFALGGVANTVSAGVVGALAGGCLGLFF